VCVHLTKTNKDRFYLLITCHVCVRVQVYERAIPAVPKAERMSVVELYVSRATDFFGVAKVRQIIFTFHCAMVQLLLTVQLLLMMNAGQHMASELHCTLSMPPAEPRGSLR